MSSYEMAGLLRNNALVLVLGYANYFLIFGVHMRTLAIALDFSLGAK
jgi:hypothetical protein